MEESNNGDDDRISHLPDAILHQILSLMPIKSAVRTSLLSNRWKDVWKPVLMYAKSLDFTHEFETCKTVQQAICNINQCLQLHSGNRIESFRLRFFYPNNECFPQIQKWVEFAVERRVKDLELEFPQEFQDSNMELQNTILFILPPCFFTCNSLTFLRLTGCNFTFVETFSCFRALKVICLKWVKITSNVLDKMLLNCPVLEELTLWYCTCKRTVGVSAPAVKLKRLTLLDCGDFKIHISAPNLLSLHFDGNINEYPLKDTSQLEDAIVVALDMPYFIGDYNYMTILSRVAHVKILTTCDVTIADFATKVSHYELDHLPIVFPNLIELQLLMTTFDDSRLNAVCLLFMHCTFSYLEKLFIELQMIPDSDLKGLDYGKPFEGGPSDGVLHRLKTIKMSNFHGNEAEMKLVQFLLEKAIMLESLILVTPEKGVENFSERNSASQTELDGARLSFLHEQLLLLPKASMDAQIVLYEYSENDYILCPTHTEVYDWPY